MAAAPISMASQAWEGRPMPASTMMGRSISSMRIWMNSRVASPLLEPMGGRQGHHRRRARVHQIPGRVQIRIHVGA